MPDPITYRGAHAPKAWVILAKLFGACLLGSAIAQLIIWALDQRYVLQ